MFYKYNYLMQVQDFFVYNIELIIVIYYLDTLRVFLSNFDFVLRVIYFNKLKKQKAQLSIITLHKRIFFNLIFLKFVAIYL